METANGRVTNRVHRHDLLAAVVAMEIRFANYRDIRGHLATEIGDTSVLFTLARKWAEDSQAHAYDAYFGHRNRANKDRTHT